jgi:hypothetical protein
MTFTSGLPALAMTNGSPLAARSTSLGQMGLGFVNIDGQHNALRMD